MSDSLQVFLLSFLGFMVSFSIVFLAIRIAAVNMFHRSYEPPKIHVDRNVIQMTPEAYQRIVGKVIQGDMLNYLKSQDKHLSVNAHGQLEEKP